ncbi:MAG: ABC transporter [Epulopiscium sp. Nele67-Bin004]|nr:MAG: ABC transporter [Epulopiscium sp. Nele67-Bin004]
MGGKRPLKIAVFLILVIIINVGGWVFLDFGENSPLSISFNLQSTLPDSYQIFYGETMDWSEESSSRQDYLEPNIVKEMNFIIPQNLQYIRIDLGTQLGKINVSELALNYRGRKSASLISNITEFNQLINQESLLEDGFQIESIGDDPYFIIQIDTQSWIQEVDFAINQMLKVCTLFAINLAIIVLAVKRRPIMDLGREIFSSRELIWNLSKNDFKTKYTGSYLGIIWAFIHPIVTILVYWFVFEFGLRASAPVANVPFVVWLATGLVPWFFFQEGLTNATNCMMEYSYLVKKVVFKISILPIVKIISALFVHLVFILVLFGITVVYGIYPDLYSFQVLYYVLCTSALVLAISYTTSAVVIFFKDLSQFISIFMQVGMWMTPIMWSYTMVPENFRWILALNPMYYITQGFRDTFIDKIWFYERVLQTMYFWGVTALLFVIGTVVFKKLKVHFADVL